MNNYQWWILLVLGLLTYILSCFGFYQYFLQSGEPYYLSDILYFSLLLFRMEWALDSSPIPIALDISRFLAPVTVASAFLKAAFVLLEKKINMLKLRSYRNHIVICGMGRMGSEIAENLIANNFKVVIIDSNKSSADFPKSSIGITGDASNIETLKIARISESETCILCNESNELNIEVANRCNELISLSKKPEDSKTIKILVHMSEINLKKILNQHPLFLINTNRANLDLFNIYEKAARKLTNLFPPDRYCRVFDLSDSPAEVLVIGLNQMSEPMLLQLGQISHYGNLKKTIVHISDQNVTMKNEKILSFHPNLNQTLDLRFYDQSIRETIYGNYLDDFKNLGAVYIFLENVSESITVPIAIRKKIEKNIPIIVCMSDGEGLSEILSTSAELLEKNIHFFHLIKETCKKEEMLDGALDFLAKAIHENYIQNEQNKGVDIKKFDFADKWEDLAESYRDANRCQADHIFVKFRTLGYDTNQLPEKIEISEERLLILAKMEHHRWMSEKFLSGWTYAPGAKNSLLKTSPLLTDWESLSEAEQKKDIDTIIALNDYIKYFR